MIKLLRADGWKLERMRGSHRKFKHPTKRGKVIVAGKLNHNLHPKTLGSIMRQAGWATENGDQR